MQKRLTSNYTSSACSFVPSESQKSTAPHNWFGDAENCMLKKCIELRLDTAPHNWFGDARSGSPSAWQPARVEARGRSGHARAAPPWWCSPQCGEGRVPGKREAATRIQQPLVLNTLPALVLVLNTLPVLVLVLNTLPVLVLVLSTLPALVLVLNTLPALVLVLRTLPAIVLVLNTLPALVLVLSTLPALVVVVALVSCSWQLLVTPHVLQDRRPTRGPTRGSQLLRTRDSPAQHAAPAKAARRR